MKEIQSKALEIFCGTGGVGKTTLATSRAFHLSKSGKKVLLITIDPSKRLKEILGLKENMTGTICPISKEYYEEKTNPSEKSHLDALLMTPSSVFDRILQEHADSEAKKNRIINILKRPYCGLNEILALVEVSYYLKKDLYDTIILDTPPGKHFLDFLDSCHRINSFFDNSFLEIFQYLGKKIPAKKDKGMKRILNLMVSSGIKKLLFYLSKVTDQHFIDEFVEAILTLYKVKEPFIEALQLEKQLKNKNFTNWFLVASCEHKKIQDTLELKKTANQFIHEDNFIILNKCQESWLTPWNPDKESPKLYHYKEAMLQTEMDLKKFTKDHWNKILEFSDMLFDNPLVQVQSLCAEWNQY